MEKYKVGFFAMHGVGSAGNASSSVRTRKEKRLSYVLNDADDTKHCAGINCLAVSKSAIADGCDDLFTGSRDGTLKRWALAGDGATCSATFESHVDWVNDAVLTGGDTLVTATLRPSQIPNKAGNTNKTATLSGASNLSVLLTSIC
ncbi:uncharacterized protein [Primulina eburnea]|uniref:uncharacterized protein n=1 Tax=Primulina eburnea TaxID=1245227 RepID=UPI003C6C9880